MCIVRGDDVNFREIYLEIRNACVASSFTMITQTLLLAEINVLVKQGYSY